MFSWNTCLVAYIIYAPLFFLSKLLSGLEFEVSAILELNDILVIRGKKFRINKLDINITTGDVSLELVTYREIVPYYGITVDTDTYTVDSGLITVDKIR